MALDPIARFEGEGDEKLREAVKSFLDREAALPGSVIVMASATERIASLDRMLTGDEARAAFRAAFEEEI